MSDQPKSNLDAKLASMQEPSSDPDCLYHAITLTADDDLRVTFGTQSQWVGWTEDGRHEIRKSRLVYAKFADLWKNLNFPYCFVHTPDELTVFLLAGGNALVDASSERKFFRRPPPRVRSPSFNNPSRALKYPLDKHLYAQRHLVECCFSKLKQFRRVATRFEKTARNYQASGHPCRHHPMDAISVHRTRASSFCCTRYSRLSKPCMEHNRNSIRWEAGFPCLSSLRKQGPITSDVSCWKAV